MVAFVHAQLYTDNATNDQQALCLPAHLSSVIDVWIRNHGVKRNPFSPLIVQPPQEEKDNWLGGEGLPQLVALTVSDTWESDSHNLKGWQEIKPPTTRAVFLTF